MEGGALHRHTHYYTIIAVKEGWEGKRETSYSREREKGLSTLLQSWLAKKTFFVRLKK